MGDFEKQCTATAKQTGERCQKNVITKGATVCKWHGGAAPQVLRAAAKRVAYDKIERMAAELGEEHGVGMDPVEHLLHEVYTSAANKAVLEREVKGWTPEEEDQSLYTTTLWRSYNEERDRHARLSKMALDAGVAERQVRLAERQAREVTDVMRAILTDLGIEVSSPETVEVIRTHMLRLEPATHAETATPRLGTTRQGYASG